MRHESAAGILVGFAGITLYLALRRADPAGMQWCLDPSGDWLRPAAASDRVMPCAFSSRGPLRGALWVECRPAAAGGACPPLRVFIVCADALDDREWRLLRSRLLTRRSAAEPTSAELRRGRP